MTDLITNNKKRLSLSYGMLSVVCFLQLIYIACFFSITSILILQHHQAATFLEQVHMIPISYERIPIYTIFGFLFLLLVMKSRSKIKETTINVLLFLILEISACLFLLRVTSFTSNEILLLVAANMLSLTRNKGNKGISLLIIVLCFLGTNYNIISRMIPVTAFDDYLFMYNAQACLVFQSIRNVLESVCLIGFILYILFLIQDQVMESKQIKDMNNELQELNEQLKEVADMREKMGETKERNRLAREIHDSLGHTLTGLSTGLEATKALMDVDPELAKEQLRKLSAVAKDGLKDVRRSVKKLRPDALENHTLKEALENMIHEFIESTNVTVHFVCHLNSLKFQQDEEDAIYRIVQESMTNSVRHGHADEIYISFGKDKETLILIIEDNGSGCEKIEEGFGLHHMKERVAMLQGTVRCYGTDGFAVLVEIPLRREHRNND